MNRKKFKLISKPYMQQEKDSDLYQTIFIKKKSGLPLSQTRGPKELIDFNNYIKQIQFGFQKSCRADIVNRKIAIRSIQDKRNIHKTQTKAEEKSSLVNLKKQISCLQQQKTRWNDNDNDQIKDKYQKDQNQLNQQCQDSQIMQKIKTINIHSFDQAENQQNILGQFKNTFHKSMYQPLKLTIDVNVKKYFPNMNKRKSKSYKKDNFSFGQFQKINYYFPKNTLSTFFRPLKGKRINRSLKKVYNKQNMQGYTKKDSVKLNQNDKAFIPNHSKILKCQTIRLNTFSLDCLK